MVIKVLTVDYLIFWSHCVNHILIGIPVVPIFTSCRQEKCVTLLSVQVCRRCITSTLLLSTARNTLCVRQRLRITTPELWPQLIIWVLKHCRSARFEWNRICWMFSIAFFLNAAMSSVILIKFTDIIEVPFHKLQIHWQISNCTCFIDSDQYWVRT